MDDLTQSHTTAKAVHPSGKTLAFVVAEDRVFAEECLPLARAAMAMGLGVAVITQVREHRAMIEAVGIRVIALDADRSGFNPMTAGYAAGQLSAILKALKADIVHCIGLRGILVGGTAAAMAGIADRVYALNGLGSLGSRPDTAGRLTRLGLKNLMRGPLASRQTRYLFNSPDDARALGLDLSDTAVTIIGGTGVDPAVFVPRPLPPAPPLTVAIVGRLVQSEGIDIAVEAVRIARIRGVDVELSLYGAPDVANPRAIPEATLEEWTRDGIAWQGPTRDVADVLAAHHIGCLVPRAGEGLPRSLLEAAACGRALLASDVPGCRDLIRDGVEGLLVPPGDAQALAAALARLAADPALVTRMGESARLRVMEGGFTEEAIGAAVARVYAELLSR